MPLNPVFFKFTEINLIVLQGVPVKKVLIWLNPWFSMSRWSSGTFVSWPHLRKSRASDGYKVTPRTPQDQQHLLVVYLFGTSDITVFKNLPVTGNDYICLIIILNCFQLLWFSPGPSVVKHHLPQMLALWANAFPKTVKEFDQEKNRGDAYTWHVTLECRAGALCCKYFILHVTSLLSSSHCLQISSVLACHSPPPTSKNVWCIIKPSR